MIEKILKENQKNLIILATLFFFGVLYRLIDYPPNFTPVAAISLFAGYQFCSGI